MHAAMCRIPALPATLCLGLIMAFSTVLSDDFVGPAGTLLKTRTGWTEVRIAGGNGKQAQLDGAGHAGSPWFPSSGTWNNRPLVRISAAIAEKHRVTTTIAATSLGGNGGILIAWDAALDKGYFISWKFGISKLWVSRIDAGVETELASAVVSSTDVTVDVTKIRAAIDPVTNTITVEVDRTGTGVWATEITTVDTTYSGGTVGLVFHTTAAQFADFLAEEEAAGGGGVTGTGAVTLASPTAGGSGAMDFIAGAAAGVAVPAADAAGGMMVRGPADAGIAAPFSAADGMLTVRGPADAVLSRLAAAASGDSGLGGTASPTISQARASASGGLGFAGAGDGFLVAPVGAITGAQRLSGVAATAAAALITTGNGTAALRAIADAAVLALAADATGGMAVRGPVSARASRLLAGSIGRLSFAGGISTIIAALRAAGQGIVNIGFIAGGRLLHVQTRTTEFVIAPRGTRFPARGRKTDFPRGGGTS